MPGLFGIHKFTLDEDLFFEQAVQKMRYYPQYAKNAAELKNAKMGRIDVKKELSREIYVDSDNQTMVCLWGDLFECKHNSIKNGLNRVAPEKIISDLYRTAGRRLVDLINGDFNCVIYDGKREKTIIFNDRLGLRPLYVYQDNRFLIYGAELKAFLAYDWLNSELNWQSVGDYLRYGYVLGDRTLFKNIMLLPPATWIEADRDGLKSSKYYYPKYNSVYTLDKIDEAADLGIALFRQSLERRLGNSRKVLIFLSGGLDSRLISRVASEYDVNITTATQGWFYSYEYQIAKKVCRTIGLKPTVRISIESNWLNQYLHDMAYRAEAQYGSFGLFWQHGVNRILGTDFDCMLNGIFGGHLSFGSPYFNAEHLNQELSEEAFVNRIDRGLNGHLYPRLENILTPKYRNIFNELGLISIKEEIHRAKDQSDIQALQQDALFLYNRIRRGMIAIDQNYHYYNDQYPFSDYELFEFYLTLDPKLMLGHRLYKQIYKRHFPELAMIPWWSTGANLYQDSNRFQMKLRRGVDLANWYIGKLTRGKLILPHPWKVQHDDQIFITNKGNRDLIQHIVDSEQFKSRGMYDPKAIQTLINECHNRWIGIGTLGIITMLELWFQGFIDHNLCIGDR